MAASGLIELIDYRPHGHHRIRYQSIVNHCNRLREEYAITDRRPPLSSPLLRNKDDDLLPFPLSDTIGVPAIAPALGLSPLSVRRLLEEGPFDCYRVHPSAPWRISMASFSAYLEGVRAGVAGHPGAYRIRE